MYLRCGGESSNNKIACLENPYLRLSKLRISACASLKLALVTQLQTSVGIANFGDTHTYKQLILFRIPLLRRVACASAT